MISHLLTWMCYWRAFFAQVLLYQYALYLAHLHTWKSSELLCKIKEFSVLSLKTIEFPFWNHFHLFSQYIWDTKSRREDTCSICTNLRDFTATIEALIVVPHILEFFVIFISVVLQVFLVLHVIKNPYIYKTPTTIETTSSKTTTTSSIHPFALKLSIRKAQDICVKGIPGSPCSFLYRRIVYNPNEWVARAIL